MMQFGVQREGAAHLRDRLTLRLLKSHDTAATVDYPPVFNRPRIHIVPAFPDGQLKNEFFARVCPLLENVILREQKPSDRKCAVSHRKLRRA
jgi:hypothetical protein